MTKAEIENISNRSLWKAKRVDNNEWIVGNYIHQYHSSKKHRRIDAIFTSDEHATYRHEIDPATLCQSTGKKDIQENLIYTNHIVDFTYSYFGGEDFNEEIATGVVDFSYGVFRIFCLNGRRKNEYLDLYSRGISTLEIIGNTIDNPELLENEKYGEISQCPHCDFDLQIKPPTFGIGCGEKFSTCNNCGKSWRVNDE